MTNLVTVTIRSTHYYLMDAAQGKLMVDAGWAGGLKALQGELRRYGIGLAEIRYLLLTHHHPDHAGLAQEIKTASGARLLLHEQQIPFLNELTAFYAGKNEFHPIQVGKDDLVVRDNSREVLRQIGVRGEILLTPGHSDDSVSLVVDSGQAFIGDLHPVDFVMGDERVVTCQSWKRLQAAGAQQFYPAHGNPFGIEVVQASLVDC